MAKKKDCPYVTVSSCNKTHTALDQKVTEILWGFKGNPGEPGDLGMAGDIRDIKRDKKWIYAILTLVCIPVVFLLVEFFLK